MLKGAIVGAMTLTIGMMSFAVADTLDAPQQRSGLATSHAGPVIKDAHISKLRSVLDLKPEQQRYWAPVESALRALARQQARETGGAGLVQRMSDRASAVAGTAMKLRRLASAARPLIRVLNDDQKQSAMSFVNSAGFAHLAAAF